MGPRSVQIIVATLWAILLAGCYPVDAVDSIKATQPAAVQAPINIGTPLILTPTAGDEMVRENPPPPPDSSALPAPSAPAPAQPRSAEPTLREPDYDPALRPIVEGAIQDLAHSLAIAAIEIEVVEVQAVVWPDTALGCPRPDMRYLQVTVDGARILLKAAGKTYEYHSGGNRPPFLCASMPAMKNVGPKIDPVIPRPRS